MKFTPETLLQIYLNGSFTEEAQAEFDALVRQDPVFAERVTQALTERLGPVPDSTVDGLASRLDGKIGDLWSRNKPSPLGPVFNPGLKIALALAASGVLFLGGRFLLTKLNHGASSGLWPATTQNLSASSPIAGEAKKTKPETTGGKTAAGVLTLGNPLSPTEQAPAPVGVKEPGVKNDQSLTALSASSSGPRNPGVLPGTLAGNQESMGSTTVPAVLAPPSPSSNSALTPKGSSPVASSETTAEGNSLRVAIDTDKTQNVTVTVLDANGLLVRHLFSGVLEAGEHTVDWDGKDELGNVVLPGDYTVILDMGGKKMSGILKVLPSR